MSVAFPSRNEEQLLHNELRIQMIDNNASVRIFGDCIFIFGGLWMDVQLAEHVVDVDMLLVLLAVFKGRRAS